MNRHLAITIGATLLLLAGCSTTEAPTAALPDAIQLEPSSIASIAVQEQKLTATDATAGDAFGYSVALSGDTALIGAIGDDDFGPDPSSGSAYVFTRDADGTWTETAKLTASDAAAIDFFGISVALSGDTALIGAFGDDDYSGAAYVFTRDANGTWTETAKLTARDAAAVDLFGWSVALSGDTALIGAYADDDVGFESGSAYVFTRDANGTWIETAKLTARDGADGDLFGYSVALGGDTALIGAYGDDDFSGSAYVFTRDANGTWSEPTKLTASDATASDFFGRSVAVGGDTALIGADGDDSRSGSAYVFTRDANGTWTETAKLTTSDAAEIDGFGFSVALGGDTALIGALGDDDNGSTSGSAYVFTRDANGTSWAQTAKLTASDAAAGDVFGISVALGGDTALIGAYADDDAGIDSGSAYAYQLLTQRLTPEQSIQILFADVDALAASGILKGGQARGLTRPLENALRSLARNDAPAACDQLADFITEVEEKAPRPLPQPEADTLITSADGIRAALGCTTYE